MMQRSKPLPGRWFIGSVFAVLAILFMLGLLNRSRRSDDVRAVFTLTATLGGSDTAGYARALAARPFEFPHDWGAHPEFRTEWWYFTGNLESDDGQRFGYQLTFFRNALAASMPDRDSGWATRQSWMAHFAVTDVRARQFTPFEQFERGAQGLAGADTTPFRVWLDSWSAAQVVDPGARGRDAGGAPGVRGNGVFPMRVVAARDDVAIDLVLGPGRPVVPNGDAGLSRKGPEPGNASFYFSLTRMPTTGTVRTARGTVHVAGDSWIDREWSTSALPTGVVGWDWFALQLDDGTGVMLYRLRRTDGSADPFSAGTLTGADGSSRRIGADDALIDVRDTWDSPLDGARYPSSWHVRIPAAGLDLDINPVLADQELNLSFRYWEGAVDVGGTRNGRPIAGRGYVELTGYGDSPAAGRSGR